MPNPQRELERLTNDSLTLTETMRAYPRTFLSPLLLAVLVLLAVFTAATAWIVVASAWGCIIFCCAPLVFEGFMPSRNQRNVNHRRRRTLIETRPLRKGSGVLAVPEGEYVTIHTWSGGGNMIYHDARKFHAENEAEAAQEYVAEHRTRTTADTGPSDDALTLARALNS